MSIKAVSWALEQKLDDPIAKLVLIGIADRYNDEYGMAWPSVKWLATTGDCSDRTVTRKLNKLEEMGLVVIERRFNETSVYKLPSMATGVTLSGGDRTVSGGGDRTVSSGVVTDGCLTNNNNNNNNKNKYSFSDLIIDDGMRKYAEELGLDADEIYEDMRLWDESQTKKKQYASLNAFWQGWCRREAKRSPRASKSQEKAVKVRELSDRQVEFARSKAEKLFMKHRHEGFAFQSILDDCLAYLKTNGGDDAWRSIGNGLENPFS